MDETDQCAQTHLCRAPDQILPQRLWRSLAEYAGARENQVWADASRQFMQHLAEQRFWGAFKFRAKAPSRRNSSPAAASSWRRSISVVWRARFAGALPGRRGIGYR